MADLKVVHIWNPETGITDLESESQSLAMFDDHTIPERWKDIRGRHAAGPEMKDFMERVKREWAIETGVIEGLYYVDEGTTRTLIENGIHCSNNVHEKDQQIDSEALKHIDSHLEAIESIYTFVSGNRTITPGYIHSLHQAMCHTQLTYQAHDASGNDVTLPLEHGTYKKLPNHFIIDNTSFQYCPPSQVLNEIESLVEINTQLETDEISTVVRCAWIHHRFTQVHPYQDGNGRVARALASAVLIKGDLLPFTVPRSERSLYRDLLSHADAGHLDLFVRFVLRMQERLIDRAESVAQRLAPSNSVIAATKRLRATLQSTDDQRRQVATRRCNIILEKGSQIVKEAMVKVCEDLGDIIDFRVYDGAESSTIESTLYAMFKKRSAELTGGPVSFASFKPHVNAPRFGIAVCHSILVDDMVSISHFISDHSCDFLSGITRPYPGDSFEWTSLLRNLTDGAFILYLERLQPLVRSLDEV